MNDCWKWRLFSKCKVLFLYGKSNANESSENITDCAVEILQTPLYYIDRLKDEITSFLY